MKNPLVNIENLTIRFGELTVIEGINLRIYPGEVLAIIGLNGAGKTTLLKAILGIYKPAAGRVTVHTKRIGYVPQSLNFDRSIPLTVKELLRAYSKKATDTETKLSAVGAIHLINKGVGSLSGGELQRVLLANALLSEPELLLLDEPTSGVDVVGEKGFFELIKDLQDGQSMGIVLVSHDIHLVYRYATQIICINKTMMCQGTPNEVAVDSSFIELFGEYLIPYEHEHN
jgi:zinc transport system ATP-binding protein